MSKRKTSGKAVLASGVVAGAADAAYRSGDTETVKTPGSYVDDPNGSGNSVYVPGGPPTEVPVHHGAADLLGHAAGTASLAMTAVALYPHARNVVDYAKTVADAKGMNRNLNPRMKWPKKR